MTRWTSGAIGRVLFQLLVIAIFVFLLAAPSIVVYYSFSPTVALHFPPEGFTWRWYLNVLDSHVYSTASGKAVSLLAWPPYSRCYWVYRPPMLSPEARCAAAGHWKPSFFLR